MLWCLIQQDRGDKPESSFRRLHEQEYHRPTCVIAAARATQYANGSSVTQKLILISFSQRHKTIFPPQQAQPAGELSLPQTSYSGDDLLALLTHLFSLSELQGTFWMIFLIFNSNFCLPCVWAAGAVGSNLIWASEMSLCNIKGSEGGTRRHLTGLIGIESKLQIHCCSWL